MAMRLTRALALFLAFCWISLSSSRSNSNSNQLAKELSTKLHSYVDGILQYKEFKNKYEAPELSLKRKNGTKIAQDMREDLLRVLTSKIDSVKLLSKTAEALKRNYSYDSSLTKQKVRFYDSKDLPGTGNLSTTIDPTFSEQISVNFNSSVIHVPTDVYDGNKTILNIIQWTKALNRQFRENNDNKDNNLIWQYFGTSKGVYRFYPGHEWSSDKMFDNRRRGWYIQGSSSPKDMVIVLDLSGSVVGSKLAIIKLSAISLLDTLQENDFVNVVVFNKGARMLCEDKEVVEKLKGSGYAGHSCNRELLQATDRNKRFLKKLIPHLKAQKVAEADEGLKLAFSLLKNASDIFGSSQCIKLINFFTDGIESSVRERSLRVFEDNIRRKDKDKVRVFSYLIGREKAVDDAPVKEFACKNNGYYFRIETLSDVREKVLGFMNVLSRPFVLSGDNSPTWVPVYNDNMGLGMMTSVVVPVFDSNDTNGALLGVVGTDVPLPLITDTVPQYKVGVNGYGFAINNNGFLLFHPKLKREWFMFMASGNTKQQPEHYKNLKEDPNVYLTEVELGSGNKSNNVRKLTREMIGRSTSHMKLQTDVISEDERRVIQRNYTFYFTKIPGTSFSSAVAIPEYDEYNFESNATEATVLGNIEEKFAQTKDHIVTISPWEYCKIVAAARSNKPLYIPSGLYPTADELAKNLSGKASIPDYCEDKLLVKNLIQDAKKTKDQVKDNNWETKVNANGGLLSLFIGTNSGLTRVVLPPNPNRTQTQVPRDLFNQEFYSVAADYIGQPSEFLIFSSDTTDIENIKFNITTPIVFEESGNKAIAAVMGMQITGETFNELFKNNSKTKCQESENVACYLLDDDAYVMASNQDNFTEVGKFFGEVNSAVMGDMINKSIYQRIVHDDSQRICDEESSDSSNAMRLLNPLWAVKAYVQWWTQTVFWSAVQFNLYSFFWERNLAVAAETPKKVSCTQTLTFYKFQVDVLSTGRCSLSCCPKSWYEVANVDNTNLLFVMVENSCTCNTPKLSRKPLKKIVKPFTTPDENFRALPQLKCYKYSEYEDTTQCGAGAAVKPTLLLILVVLLINLFIMRN